MSTITYIVKIASGKFTIDDAVAPKLTFRDGDTYIFDQSDNSNSGHILQFSATSNNSGSSEYTTGVTKTGTAGQAGAKTTIVTSSSTTDTLYYYSSGGGDHGREFSNSGFNTSANYNVLKPIVGSSSTAEKWGAMVNHAIDQIDLQAKDNRDYTDQHAFQGEPHIIPDTLYPAVAGNDLDGTDIDTSHGSTYTYGTTHADGRMYYYTDLKGSKPIKDPRIGAHFGSQRHKFKSLQKLEQETATHGKDTYSIDGREWVRLNATYNAGLHWNTSWGNFLEMQTANDFIEITGYFNDVNVLLLTYTNLRYFTWSLDGGSSTVVTNGRTTVSTPLGGRYVDTGSLHNIGLGATLGIHTLKILNNDASNVGQGFHCWCIELIAQDTTSTANKSKIQIPAQNVVSYGKKFSIPATAHHYNPFATKGDGSASTIPNNTTGDSVATGWTGSTSAYWESTLDTATSLGLSAWEAGSTVYYRPVNGGRVVKWVDSSGNIKTSVNMMPPESHAIEGYGGSGASTCLPTGTHNWSTQYQPQFGNKTVGSAVASDTCASNNTSNWENTGSASISFDTDHYEISNSGTTTSRLTSLSVTAGKFYKISAQFKNGTASSIGIAGYLYDGSNAHVGQYVSTTGSFTYLTWVFKSTSTSSSAKFGVNVNSTSSNNIEMKSFTVFEVEDPSIQAEVAKTFNFREFGNGSANGNASYKDASTLTGTSSYTDIAYVMDDGLTSLSGDDVKMSDNSQDMLLGAGGGDYYFTFIGTGITTSNTQDSAGTDNIAQNLPYGTHILKVHRHSSGGDPQFWIDGVDLDRPTIGTYAEVNEITFHQPKMPPIPEDAVVIADYMLMADFVANTGSGLENISKGVRYLNASRDIFYDQGGSTWQFQMAVNSKGYRIFNDATSTTDYKLPFFGHGITYRSQSHTDRIDEAVFKINDDVYDTNFNSAGNYVAGNRIGTSSPNAWDTSADDGTFGFRHSTSTNREEFVGVKGLELGSNKLHIDSPQYINVCTGMEIHSPIHTSSHYQTFETPFLHELVGGDRNMEQNNLVVTPDGKTWDEVTRDTSYIGNVVLQTNTNVATNWSTAIPFIYWRGADQAKDYFNKDFAIAYDRIICLVDGWYEMFAYGGKSDSTTGHLEISVNGVANTLFLSDSGSPMVCQSTNYLKRGDSVQVQGEFGVQTATRYNNVYFKRLDK